MIIIPFTGDETETENLTFKINTSKAERSKLTLTSWSVFNFLQS